MSPDQQSNEHPQLPKPDLELATTEELIEELKKRHDVFVAILRRHICGTDPKDAEYECDLQLVTSGDQLACIGAVSQLKKLMQDEGPLCCQLPLAPLDINKLDCSGDCDNCQYGE